MAETFTAILTAHLLADFVFQNDWMVKQKRHVRVLILHIAIVTACAWFLIGAFHWAILLVIALSHLGIDATKANLLEDSPRSLLVDQFVHLAVLVILAGMFPNVMQSSWWAMGIGTGFLTWYFAVLSLISGLILIVPAGGILIGKTTRRFADEIGDDDIAGLKKGGQYIGWLERSLVMLLLLINQPTGIGFLITAKSILRFGEIKEAKHRKVTEYIIIGTFLSFGWALLISAITQVAIQHWLAMLAH